jgi:hypothetical protein
LESVIHLPQESLGWLLEHNLDLLPRRIRAHAQHARQSKNLLGGAAQQIQFSFFSQPKPHHTHLEYLCSVIHFSTPALSEPSHCQATAA